jgi:hypothetical protein
MSMRDRTGGLPGSYRARSQTPSKATGGMRLSSGSIFEKVKVIFFDVLGMISKGRMDCNRKRKELVINAISQRNKGRCWRFQKKHLTTFWNYSI